MESIRTGLRQIVQDLLGVQPVDEVAILVWPLVCGKEVAARTRATGFAGGRLTVEVSDAAWRAQLAALAPRYVTGFAELIGPVVCEVEFKTVFRN
jgi:hypothetical protein